MVTTLLIGLLIGGGGGAVGLYWQSIEELNELFDDRLRNLGDNLSPETLDRSVSLEGEDEDDGIVVQLWTAGGRLLFDSSPNRTAPAPAEPGLSTLKATSARWRSYAIRTTDGGFLQVAQELAVRQDMAAGSVFRLLLPLLTMLPLIAAFSAWAVARNLRPLRALAEQLTGRDALTRSEIRVAQAPSELSPVVAALNELLKRQADASHQQQAFLADAAHELRTPLAVVSLQAQRAQKAMSEAERAEALDALQHGSERATRLVTQLLALARSEHGASDIGGMSAVDLEPLLKTVLAELYPLAAHKQLDLGLSESSPCVVSGDLQDLRGMIVNLIDNAIRYTPSGGRVDVCLRRSYGSAHLLVTDTGPGIPENRRLRVFKRFARDGAADGGGTGLGLAIAQHVAERHGGSISLDGATAATGLTVRVVLPLAG